MIWDYTPEVIKYDGKPNTNHLMSVMPDMSSSWKDSLVKSNMMAPMWDFMPESGYNADNPFGIGTKKSYMPPLGKKIWESSSDDLFHAYIYQAPDKRLIGYVRIPSYSVENADKSIEAFKKIVEKFESTTEAMVIDQINNPGGSVFYLYTIAALLTDQSLFTPQHKMRLTPSNVMEAIQGLAELKNVTNDEEAIKVVGPTLGGYPTSYQAVLFIRDYFNFIISEYNSGRTLTAPHHIWGVDRINPYPDVHYTKPIVLVTNALDFSGGDFFPAIMQDNKRVTIFGANTAGAGGYVEEVTFINAMGISKFTYTASIAERLDRNPIENLGVKPDVSYSLTQDDFENGFAAYAKAINQTVLSRLE